MLWEIRIIGRKEERIRDKMEADILESHALGCKCG